MSIQPRVDDRPVVAAVTGYVLAVVTARMPVIALAAVLMLVAAADSQQGLPAEQADRRPRRRLQDAVRRSTAAGACHGPADNAVENAVGKLDGIAEELMKRSGIPGMAVAVVHGGKTVYAKGFGVKDVRTGERSIPARFSSWRRCPNR